MGRMPNLGGMGMGNMQNLIKQAKKMQQQMEAERESLNQTEFVGKSSDDMVIATLTGDKKVKDLKIAPEAIDPEDPDMLQDLIIDAINKAISEVDVATEKTMGKYTKGLM
ncbi:MAG: YbaB/EbfC family nucleoid-associated protein [Lactobacillus iners]|nr:YbaB/EbfC family nucleoid-associated protein [Lactobacillus iners]